MCAFVLVAEDDVKQADILRRYLEQEGHTVTVVHDGASALDIARTRGPDLVVLDVMMPLLDGLDVCRLLRRDSQVPVLMLTARSTEDDLLLGLDLGADDYLTKPYSPRELMARIRTLLRRTRSTAEDHVLRAGAVTVDPRRHEAFVDGRPVECTAGEFALLTVLAEQPGRVFTRQQLLERTKGYDKFITERIIDVHVMNLRKKIEADPRRPAHLLTVYRVGYKLSDGGRDAP
ncbi:response regulator transcription factor [Crossiella cryophila]|uniref:DNA-binding response OmpR family regulator n=1 Tax=Crossiella cryophila TaxID=43355 RepID=A0A7W7CB12_9PSEU|nr:response regulator transcription factor [Crossiella cryophila]MBB4677862.1 DNA-binding response OmpR family regulator [Crossiella cryophila]